MGRPLAKTNAAGATTSYQYISSGNGLQQIEKIIGPEVINEFKYDNFNRVIESKETLINSQYKVFKTNFTYDKYGRLKNYAYPNGFETTYEYDQSGQLTRIKHDKSTLWQLDAMITPENISTFSYTNGLTTTINYDNLFNLKEIIAGSISKQSYQINNNNGDLDKREYLNYTYNYGSNQITNETFRYDNFDRVEQIDIDDGSGNTNIKDAYAYEANGNLTYKSDCGNYFYANTSSPYKITGMQVTNPQNNNISLNTLNLTFNDIQKVSQISDININRQLNFTYGNGGQRVKMVGMLNGQNQYTRYYQTNFDRQETSTGFKEWCYVYSPTGLCAVYYNNNGNKQMLHITTDHLGSPAVITNSTGIVLEELSYDAWGRRRNPNDWQDYNVQPQQYLIRGFTTHETLEDVGVINMNGRIYDPVLGRFVQPDPFIQEPGNDQNFNRFSYCLNNPLKYTDMSGYDYGGGKMRHDTQGQPVLYVDGIRIEPNSAGYRMYSNIIANGGNGSGVSSVHFYGVSNGNGVALKSTITTRGGLIDQGLLINTKSEYRTVNGKQFAAYYPEVATNATKTSPGIDATGGVILIETSYINTGALVAQSGGGIDPFGVALGVGELAYQGSAYSSFGRTAGGVDNLLKNGKYLHNGEVYYQGNYKGVTNAMKSSLSSAKLARNIGRGFAYVGAATALYDFANSNQTGADYARLTGAALITASAFIPVVGPFISIGLGIADSFGAFDDFYNSKR